MFGRADLQGRGGFLLLEALIALVVIGTVSIALLAATAAHVRSADKAAVLMVAAALTQDRMAAIHFLDHEGLTRPPDSLLSGRFGPPFDEFTWQGEVTAADGEYDLFAARMEVGGRGEAFLLETLIHRPQGTLDLAVGGNPGGGGQPGGGGRGGAGGGGGGAGQGGRGGTGGGGALPGGGGGGGGRGGGGPGGGGS